MLLITKPSFSVAQEVLLLKPGPEEGRDVQLWSYDPVNCLDRGTDRHDLVIHHWTKNGTPVSKCSMIRFDLSKIPVDVEILNARLSLFHCPDSFDQGHAQLSGSNEAVIQRVTSPWEEDVCWNDLPESTPEHQVFIPASTNETQNYKDIDVLGMVREMVRDPDHGHGFLISMVKSGHYRSLTFASSDHPVDSLHPELEVIYLPGCNQKPEVSIGPDRSICNGDSLILEASCQDPVEYLWSDGSKNSTLIVKEAGNYWVKVENSCGLDSDSITIEYRNLQPNSIPNAFTPNEDDINEAFQLPLEVDARIHVFNRWGKLVYHSEHYENDWNGDHLPSGNYYFSLFDHCTRTSMKGWIYILR